MALPAVSGAATASGQGSLLSSSGDKARELMAAVKEQNASTSEGVITPSRVEASTAGGQLTTLLQQLQIEVECLREQINRLERLSKQDASSPGLAVAGKPLSSQQIEELIDRAKERVTFYAKREKDPAKVCEFLKPVISALESGKYPEIPKVKDLIEEGNRHFNSKGYPEARDCFSHACELAYLVLNTGDGNLVDLVTSASAEWAKTGRDTLSRLIKTEFKLLESNPEAEVDLVFHIETLIELGLPELLTGHIEVTVDPALLESVCETSSNLDIQNPLHLLTLACYLEKDYKKALATAQKIEEAKTGNIVTRYILARCLERENKTSEALTAYQGVLVAINTISRYSLEMRLLFDQPSKEGITASVQEALARCGAPPQEEKNLLGKVCDLLTRQ